MTDETDAPEAPENAPNPTDTPADWRDGLDLEPEIAERVGKFNNVGDLAKSYAHADRLISSRADQIAGDPELAAMIRQSIPDLNAPESPDQYEYQLPEIKGWDSEMEGELRAMAHELGVPNSQFAGLMTAYAESVAQQEEQQAETLHQETQKTTRALKGEWGGEYERKLDDYRMVRDMLPADVVEGLFDAGMFARADVIQAFAEIGEQLSEGGMPGGESRGGGLTPDMAEREISLKMADAGFMARYTDKDNPGHAQAVEEMAELHRQRRMVG